MAQTTVIGKATIYNLDGTVAYTGCIDNAGTAATVVAADNYLQSINLTDEVDTTELRDAKGNVQGMDLYNHRRTATIEFIPIGSTVDAAAGKAALPKPGAVVQVAETSGESSSETELPGIFTADTAQPAAGATAVSWQYIGGGTVSLSNTDMMRFSLPCRLQNADPASTEATGLGVFDTTA